MGVVAERLAKTLMSPLFSVTKTRSSGEKRIAVGYVNPQNTTDSENPAGMVAAWAGWVIELRRYPGAVETRRNEARPLLIILLFPRRMTHVLHAQCVQAPTRISAIRNSARRQTARLLEGVKGKRITTVKII